MSRLILHRAFGSPPARSVMMLGDMLDLKLEIKDLNLIKMEHKTPEFLKMNPMGTVPVLQDGDFTLSESHAILKYLVESYGGDKGTQLYPREPRPRAVVDQCMFFNSGVFFSSLLAVAAPTLLGNLTKPSAHHRQRVESSYSVLEAYLQNRQYVAADHLTLADLSAGSTATAIQVIHKVDPAKYPRCAEWLSHLQEMEVFKTINAPGAAFFGKLMTKAWERNGLNNKA